MRCDISDQISFLSEMSSSQIEVCEFFSKVLLESLSKNFDLNNTLIYYFDTKGNFNSWVDQKGNVPNNKNHIYNKIINNDVIRNLVFQEALRDGLTYFNTKPRIYRSSEVIKDCDYDTASYVKFINENFNAHYSLSMAFGINAYIQISFFKSYEQGDFTNEELEMFTKIYVYIANAYKNFKKHEQAKIISNIQNEIIATGEKAYLVIDRFMHILSYNEIAKEYLTDIWGESIVHQISCDIPCLFLSFILESENNSLNNLYKSDVIRDFTFKTRKYHQSYSNGIVDTYSWITISRLKSKESTETFLENTPLTKAEIKVANLMSQGMTYKKIATKLEISYHTVKKHVQNIYTKCGVKNRFEMCKWLDMTIEN